MGKADETQTPSDSGGSLHIATNESSSEMLCKKERLPAHLHHVNEKQIIDHMILRTSSARNDFLMWAAMVWTSKPKRRNSGPSRKS